MALLIFNRPELTRQVIDAIAAAKPPRLLVVGDGPRADHPEDVALVAAARAALTRVDWPCNVQACFSDVNLGCGVRVSTGLDWVFSEVDEAVILEDDCVPDHSFFPFCERLLERFRDDPRVHMVSGSNVMEPDPFLSYSYGFSRAYNIWGWATWRRAWRHYDFEMQAWPELRETNWLAEHLRSESGAHIARLLFDATYDGRIQQWDFQWVLAGWLNDAVAAVPSVNLVTNIGHGHSGTHLKDPSDPLARLPVRATEFPLRHPPVVEVLEERDRALWESTLSRYPVSGSRSARSKIVSALRHRSIGSAGSR